VIRGDTKAHIDIIKAIKMAKFGYFGGEPGWLFPLTQERAVRAALGDRVRPGYVDGPKPNPKTTPGTYEKKQDDLIMVKPSVPLVKGKLRGGPLEDPEVSEERKEFPSEQFVNLLKRLETVENTVVVLAQKLNELGIKFDSFEVVEPKE
jgi:hypothetical protein